LKYEVKMMKDKLSFVGGIAPEVMGTLARKMCDDKSCNQNSLNQSEKKIINNDKGAKIVKRRFDFLLIFFAIFIIYLSS